MTGQTTTAGRTNSGGDTRAPGLGGLGMLGGDPTVGATPDASQMNQFLQNPAMSQMMQSLLSNPQYMNQVMHRLISFRPWLLLMVSFNFRS